MSPRVSNSQKKVPLCRASLILLLSFIVCDALAATPQELVNKYGKYRVLDAITELTHDYSFTIHVNKEKFVTNSADPKYITAETIAIDMKRHGISSAELEEAILAKENKDQVLRQGLTIQSNVIPPDGEGGATMPAISDPNPACLVSRSKASADRLKKVQAQYPGSHSLHQVLVDTTIEDYDFICSIERSPESDSQLSDLFNKYYPNYSLIRMLYERNMDDLGDLER